MRFLPHIVITALSIALFAATPCAWAQSGQEEVPRNPPAQREAMPPRNAESLSDSVRRAQRESGGQILGAERVQYDGREINRVKVMDNSGRVRYMDDDPQRRDRMDRRVRRSPREDVRPPARGDNPPRQ